MRKKRSLDKSVEGEMEGDGQGKGGGIKLFTPETG